MKPMTKPKQDTEEEWLKRCAAADARVAGTRGSLVDAEAQQAQRAAKLELERVNKRAAAKMAERAVDQARRRKLLSDIAEETEKRRKST